MSEPSPPAAVRGAADAACLPEGYRINEYVVERTLGGGGFGTTYLARDVNLDLPVAIKEYFPGDLAMRGPEQSVLVRHPGEEDGAGFGWGLERFLDEARALATFRHPNIIRVLRYFRANGTAYIVMEYESGLPLKRWVPQNAPITRKMLLSLVHPLLDGLEAVHRQGFLHRDIKPDNIYIRADGTPVLLDFGAARRVSAERDLTNIVSPGFAPFEQYHSEGNQGPWTDLYALGAVLYWITTGKKPPESAGRVKTDSMLPASSLAAVNVYGTSLLHAIEWAMQPDERKRPQSVPELRAAIQATQPHDAGTAGLPAPAAGDPPATSTLAPPLAGVPASHASAPQRRNLVGTILSADLVGYARRPGRDQQSIHKLFTEMIGKSLKGVEPDSRIAVDTGDGAMAICFLGDPEEALHSALLLRDLLEQRYGDMFSARIGLHMGPVRLVGDLHHQVNVVGDGINVAQRIMDFAKGGQVLVSRAYYDVISRITDDTAGLFRYLGQHEDKQGRRHEVYCAEPGQGHTGNTRREGPSTGYTQTRPAQALARIDPVGAGEVEAELARQIGPLARVLVRKAQARALTTHDLREALAPSIQDPVARETFLAGPPALKHAVTRPTSDTSASAGRGTPPGPGADLAARPDPTGRSPVGTASTTSGTLPPAASRPAPGSPMARDNDVTSDELALIEHHLSRHIGPLARVLLRKEAARTREFADLISAAARNIDRAAERDAFIAVLRKSLPTRQF
jgi:serine/threonine protein kinase